MIKYILFDLDDTLYSASSGVWKEISDRMNEYMVRYLGIAESQVTHVREDYWRRYGTTLRGLYIERHIDAQGFLHYVHDIRVDKYLQADLALEAMLGGLSHRKAIFTNATTDHARRVLAALGVERHFADIFDINFIEYESKPAPSGYRKVLTALGARAEECLMVDDAMRNLLPAKALGMHTIWVDGHNSNAPNDGADAVIKSIYEMAGVLS